MRLRRLVVAIGLLVLILSFGAPGGAPTVQASSAPKDGFAALGLPGPYAVGFTSYILVDESRPGAAGYDHRPIPLYLWYPADKAALAPAAPEAVYPLEMLYRPDLKSPSSEWEAMGYDHAYQDPAPSSNGPFPLVLLSTGWGPHPWSYVNLATRLASHGFVVAVPYHTGDQFLSWEPADHLALALWNRPRDISFALTHLLDRSATPADAFFGVIDPDRVVAGGHSLGGYATLTLAGGDDTTWDYAVTDPESSMDPPIPEDVPHTPSLPDPRVKALVLLDAANQELRIHELERVQLPALSLNEEWDAITQMDPAMTSWQARQHAALSGQPSYRVDVGGTRHWAFSDGCDGFTIMDRHGIQTAWGTNDEVRSWVCVGMMPSAKSRAIVSRYVLAFLKTQLLGQTGYEQMFTPGWALTTETTTEFFVTEKGRPKAGDGEWPEFSIYFQHQPGSPQFRMEKKVTGPSPLSRHR
jgi:predicted dienelactone hydrolase